MANKDIKLVIQAKNNASKAIDQVSGSLSELTDSQKRVGETSKKVDGLLGSLGSEFKKLNTEISSLTALAKVNDQLTRAGNAAQRMEDGVADAAVGLAKSSKATKEAAEWTELLAQELKELNAIYAQQKAAVTEAAANNNRQSAAKKELTRANTAMNKILKEEIALREKAQTHETKDRSAALAQAKVKAAADLSAATEQVLRNNAAHEAAVQVRDKTAASLSELKSTYADASKAERQLAQENERLTASYTEQTTELAKAREIVGSIEKVATETAGALGLMSASQDELAAATNKVQAELEQTEAAMKAMARFSDGGGDFVDPKAAEAIRKQREEVERTREAHALLDAQTRKLASAMASTLPPTRQQAEALSQSERATAAASTELQKQLKVLADVSGATAKANAEISKTTKVMDLMQKFGDGGGNFIDPKAAEAIRKQRVAVDEARDSYETLNAEADRLNKSMGKATPATREQAAAMVAVAAAAKAAEGEWVKQINNLDKLTGVTAEFEAELQKTTAALLAMARFSDGGGNFVDPKSAAAIRKQRAEVELAEQAYKELAAESDRLAAAMRGLKNPSVAQVKAFHDVTAASRVARVEMNNQIATLNKMPGAMAKANGIRTIFAPFYGESRKAMNMAQRVRGEILSLATAYVGLYQAISQVGGVITAFQKMEAAQNRLGVVFAQNQGAISNELAWLERQASRLGIEFGVLSDEYSKFAVAANAANFASENTRKIFLSVAESGRVNKLSMDQMSGVFLAIQQMISKGKVSSEELRRQLGDRMAGAFNIFADALGLTAAQLDDMMKKGQILADETTILKFADELNKRFGPQLAESLKSTTTLMGQFTNEIFQAQLRVGNGGFMDAFNESLATMIEHFRSREGRDFFLSLGATLGNLTKAFTFLLQNLELVGTAFKLFIAIKITQTILNTAKAIGGVLVPAYSALRTSIATTAVTMRAATGAMATARAAAIGLGAALKTIPAFAAISLITYGVSAGLEQIMGQVSDANTLIDEHARLMGNVLEAYDAAKGKAVDWREGLGDLSLDQLESNYIAQLRLAGDATEAFNKKLRESGGVLNNIGRVFDGFESTQTKTVRALFDSFNPRTGNLKQFIADLEKLNSEMNDPKAKMLAAEILKMARELDKANGRVVESAVFAKELGSQLNGVTEAAAGAANGIETFGEAAADSAEDVDFGTNAVGDYITELEKLKGLVPELAAEIKMLNELAKIDAQYDATVGAIDRRNRTAGDQIAEAGRIRDIGRNGVMGAYDKSVLDAIDTTPLVNSLDTNSAELRTFYESIKGRSNLMNRNPDKYGDPSSAAWRDANLTTLTGGGMTRDVNRQSAAAFQGFVNELEALGYKIKQFGAYNYRNKVGGNTLSEHAYGNAIDINWDDNPFTDILKTDMPEQIGLIAAKYGLSWGGDWRGKKDAMHFEWTGQTAPGSSAGTAGQLAEQKELIAAREKQAELDRKAAEDRKKASDDTDKSIADSQFELSMQELMLQGKERQAAIETAIRDARLANPDITAEQLAQTEAMAAALWDQANATYDIKKQEEEISKLREMQQELMSQMELHAENGQMEQALALREQLFGVNEQLNLAIERGIAMWEVMGGPGADLAIEKLKGMGLALQESGKELEKLGQNAEFTQEKMTEMLASGLVGVFDKFAQAIASGEDAVGALWDAFKQFAADFLIQIGQMILKQLLLNALQGLGGGIAGILGGLFHTGGIAGQATQSRSVNPAWFNGAVRYHEGGIAGLKPGEVPAILMEGEQILTEDDPNHVKNRSNSQGGVKVVNMIDSGSFVSEGLNTTVGENAFMNFISANAGQIKSALG